MNTFKKKTNYDSPCDSDNDWTNSSGDSKYSDSESSVPEWDSDIEEDGELAFIKLKPTSDGPECNKALLENCETFKLRNTFKRTSTRHSSRGRIFKVLKAHKGKKNDDANKRIDTEPNSSNASQSNEENNVVVQVSRNMIFSSEKNCQIEKLFGISLETHPDGKTLIVADFLTEARIIYTPRIKKGYYLHKINGIDVNSYNLNGILQRVAEDYSNPKLTFQVPKEDFAINIMTLLTSKTAPENRLMQILRDSLCSVLYICCNDIEQNSNDDKDMLYCYPRPFNQNFLYNTQGAYVTLNHLAPKSLGMSEPTSTTVLLNGKLINIIYTQNFNDLLLIAFPNKEVDLFAAKKVVVDVVRVLEFLYGSLKSCFTKSNNVDKLDCMFSRFFVTLLYNKPVVNNKTVDVSCFEDVLAAYSVPLPLEVRVQIDDAITELEAADYSEWYPTSLAHTILFVNIFICTDA